MSGFLCSLCILPVAFPASTVHARLAETRAQVEARYGKAVSTSVATDIPGLYRSRYEHEGLSVEVTYIHDVCYGEKYERTAAGKPFSRDEIQVLLEANRCGLLWLTNRQALFDQSDRTVVQPNGDVSGSLPDTVFEPGAGEWFLCNPRLAYEWCAGATAERASGEMWTSLQVMSFSIQKYVDNVHAAQAKAVLKGF